MWFFIANPNRFILYYIRDILIDNIEEAKRNQNKERECFCMEIFINFLEKHKELD